MDNRDIARVFDDIADLLAVKGDSPFKTRAYHAAARTIAEYPEELRDYVARGGGLRDIPGIGEAIARKTTELLETGRLEYFEGLRASLPPGTLELLKIRGIGPRTAASLISACGVTSVDELEAGLRSGALPAMGQKRAAALLSEIAAYREERARRDEPRSGGRGSSA